ncbi:hypothetical protein [Methanoregula sp.]|uniref:hypothetical protein n=1 Tax=Methanoregula sp. TaxID=2052170 RepID=UPI0035636F1F
MDLQLPHHGISWKITDMGRSSRHMAALCRYISWRQGRLFRIALLCGIAILLLAAMTHGVTANQTTPRTAAEDPCQVTPGVSSTSISLPSIAPNDTPGFLTRQYVFPFQDTTISIQANVSNGLYFGAKNGNKFALIPEDVAPETVVPDYYRAFVNDPAQETLNADLTGQFRKIRKEHEYSEDEYLELLTVFVQSFPYDTSSGARVGTLSRFPVETIVERTGDCDDKSVLLAGLLSREGYNVSLLLFIPEHHMAVGVAGDDLQYGDTGYIWIETTDLSFVGEMPQKLNQAVKYVPAGQVPEAEPVTSAPVVIRVNSGSKRFTHTNETLYILAQKRFIDTRIALLKEEINTHSRDDPSRFRRLLEEYRIYGEIHNTLVKHRYDRVGMYHYLLSLQQPACTRSPVPSLALSSREIPTGSGAGTSSPNTRIVDPSEDYLPGPIGIRVPDNVCGKYPAGVLPPRVSRAPDP